MSKRKSVLGIAVLCALALSAVVASSASASSATAYTCVQGKGVLNGAHCLGTSGGEYGHVEIKENEVTTGTATNANTASSTTAATTSILKGALAGVETELSCTETHGEGTFSNKTEGGEMLGHAEGKLHYTGCKVLKPVEKGCKVANEGTITTENLTGRTISTTQVEIKPVTGTKFTDIKIENCSIAALNNTFPVSGTLKASITGATLTSTHAQTTTDNTLKFGGVKAGLEGALTLKAHSQAGETTNALTVT
ncbi:MAG TPA: hypothetical protein VFJ57_09165 [Solirubrobacterales bacterium]|nr:hypothetical protein [Solirubrobacterales bacterium]